MKSPGYVSRESPPAPDCTTQNTLLTDEQQQPFAENCLSQGRIWKNYRRQSSLTLCKLKNIYKTDRGHGLHYRPDTSLTFVLTMGRFAVSSPSPSGRGRQGEGEFSRVGQNPCGFDIQNLRYCTSDTPFEKVKTARQAAGVLTYPR